ncbi:MAG: methyltransferase domain-containing protein [Opitutales bacterium]
MSDTPHHPDFWNVRYETGRTGWDLGGIPARLSRYLAAHPSGGRVLIPGSGSGWELAAFAAAGWDALALDFAPAAVTQARARLGPALAARVLLGDFFTQEIAGPRFDAIYERTFLCALPPELRPAYVRRVHELLQPEGVLLGFFYLGTERGGPPYALFPEDDQGLLGPAFTLLQDEPSPDALPLFAGGERWRELRPRPGGAPRTRV